MQTNQEHDQLYKAVIIGDAKVGKTKIVQRYGEDVFTDNYNSTIGVEFMVKKLVVDDQRIKL